MAESLIPYGMSAAGFNTKSFNQVKIDLQIKLYEAFGAIRIDEESVFGQLIGVFAEPTAQEWLALEAVYNSLNPDTATDFSLDNIAAYIGIKRLEATATTVIAQLTGVNQTIIPAGSEATAIPVNTVFKLNSEVVIDNAAFIGANLDLDFEVAKVYQVTINNNVFTYTAQPLNVKDTVIDALVSAINTAAIGVTASNSNDRLIILSNSSTTFKLLHNANLSIITITVNGNFTAVDKGAIALPAGALTNIQTPISGWQTITNASPGLIGRNLEIDDELRIRRTRSLKLAGAGTVDAIRARVLNITGVTATSIIENATNAIFGSIPPHSFETLVLGGADQDIANTIWQVKPAGIGTFGNVSLPVLDSAGKAHIVSFSRPVKLYIYATVTLTKNALYPLDGDLVIKNGIVKQIMGLEVGEDVIYQSLYQSIYDVPGIISAVIQIGGSLVEIPPVQTSSNVSVDVAQIAVSDITKINIV